MRIALFAFFCLTLAAQNRTFEADLAKQLAEEVRLQTTPVDSQAVQNYVEQLGAKLAAELPGAVPYTFSVVETHRTDASYDALALPGGYVFVPLKLPLTAKDEADQEERWDLSYLRGRFYRRPRFACFHEASCQRTGVAG
jgi:hypothetical protein